MSKIWHLYGPDGKYIGPLDPEPLRIVLNRPCLRVPADDILRQFVREQLGQIADWDDLLNITQAVYGWSREATEAKLSAYAEATGLSHHAIRERIMAGADDLNKWMER